MSLKEQTKQVIEVCKKVADFIFNERKSFSNGTVQAKANQVHDLVTHVDVESEKRLIKALKSIEPQAGFITEETNHQYKSGLNWIIDPIDGTTNFVQNVPHYCISVALANNEDILLGVVCNVANGDIYYSYKGGLSYCNADVLKVSDKKAITDALIATGFSVKDNSRLKQNLQLLQIIIEQTRGVRRLGSAALDLCYVAKGVFDAYYESNLSAWDVAAGILIVKNAGGQISDYKNGSEFLFGNEILATNGNIHSQLLRYTNY
ncbi:MAG: inositol monophosphatase family protein [Bacteroidia bacterium]